MNSEEFVLGLIFWVLSLFIVYWSQRFILPNINFFIRIFSFSGIIFLLTTFLKLINASLTWFTYCSLLASLALYKHFAKKWCILTPQIFFKYLFFLLLIFSLFLVTFIKRSGVVLGVGSAVAVLSTFFLGSILIRKLLRIFSFALRNNPT